MKNQIQKILLLVCVTLFLAGCSSVPKQTAWLKPGESFGQVEASLVQLDSVVYDKSEARTKGTAMGVTGTAGGAAVGAVGGAVYGLGCGPFAIICSPAGAVIGLVGGGIAGSSWGDDIRAGGISEPKAEQFNVLSLRYFDQSSIEHSLKTDFQQLISTNWVVDPDGANSVKLEVLELAFNQTGDEFLQLEAQARMTWIIDGKQEAMELVEKSDNLVVDDWLMDEGEKMGEAREGVVTRLLNSAAQILAGEYWQAELELLEEKQEEKQEEIQ